MYTTLRGIPKTNDDGAAGPAAGVRRRRVSQIVLTLGTVSLFTDLSSEMVVAVLPVYLTLILGLTPLQYGIIDGLYQGVTAAVRIAGGIAADLTRRPKFVAALGYGLSCVCKLFFLPAHSFTAITALVAIDRSGKGLRTAPRDAMIVEASEPASLGFSFGVHRAMDTAGALGGPLLSFGVLALLIDGYHTIFVLSFSLAAVGVAVLVLFVPNRAADREAPDHAVPDQAAPDQAALDQAALDQAALEQTGPEQAAPEQRQGSTIKHGALRRTIREFGALAKGRAYRRLLAVGALLSLLTISDGFVYLTLKERIGIGATWFPLLYVGTAAAYLLLAVPAGRLADRIGRVQVFLGGHVLAALGYLALWLLPPGPALIAGVLTLVGVYYAATDGVLPALTAPIVPESVRTSGIAGVQTMMAVGSMGSAAVFGAIWARVGQRTAVASFAIGLAIAIVLAYQLLRNLKGLTQADSGSQASSGSEVGTA